MSPALARVLAILRGRRDTEMATIAKVFDVIFGECAPRRKSPRT